MAQQDQDRQFDEYLRGRGELSRLYDQVQQSDTQSPDPRIEQRILDAARATSRRRRSPTWYVPTSLAAVLVMSFVLVLYYRHEQPAPQFDRAPTLSDEHLEGTPAPAMEAQTPRQREQDSATLGANSQPKPETLKSKSTFAESEEPASVPAETGAPKKQARAGTTFQRPAPWLEHIRSLLEQGDREQAKAQLKAFRQRYPDYRLAEDYPDLEKLARTIFEPEP